MMQNINFYHVLRKPGRYALTGQQAKVWLTRLIVGLLVISLIQFLYFIGEKGSLWYFVHRQTQLPEEMKVLANISPDMKKIMMLTASLKEKERTLIARNTFLQSIAKENYTTVFMISDDFRAVMMAIPPKVWLTQLSFENQGKIIVFKGKSTSADQLLTFVSALEKQESYQGYPWSLSTKPINDAEGTQHGATLSFTVETKSA